MRGKWAAACLAFVALVDSPAPAIGQPGGPANSECLACHADAEPGGGGGGPLAVSEAVFSASVHGQVGLACVDCHADLARVELPHEKKPARAVCSACHDAAVTAYDGTIHAAARRLAANTPAAGCADCHGTHDIRPSSDPASRTYALRLPATCGRCHGDPEIIRRGGIRAGDVLTAYEDSIHGRAVSESGLLVAPNCTHCHGAHEIRRLDDSASRVHRSRVSGTCGRCHEGIRSRFDRGVHGAALAAGNRLAPVCQDCHRAHGIQSTETTGWRLEVIRECGTCHRESLRTYRDTFHGQVTALGLTRVAACADCHGAHDIHPASDPRSSVAPGRLVETCGRCHTGATKNFVKYDPHADKDDYARNPALYIASRSMTALLTGVFLFFGIHTALWSSRGIRAGGPRRRPPDARGKPVDRGASATATGGRGPEPDR